ATTAQVRRFSPDSSIAAPNDCSSTRLPGAIAPAVNRLLGWRCWLPASPSRRHVRSCFSSSGPDMLAGFNGHLVSEAYLEGGSTTVLPIGDRSIETTRGGLSAWRARSSEVGPACAPRRLLEDRAVPLLAALGFDPPTAVSAADGSLVATVSSPGQAVTVVVTAWGERLDPLWRLAVVQARRRS